MTKELTQDQIYQIDHVQNTAHRAMKELLGKELEWDMAWIGEMADAMVDIAIRHFGEKEEVIYPFIDEEE
jgi:hypothetical protein